MRRTGKLQVLKGTTTIGVVCRDGVVLTTDTRATMGSFVAHKHAKKVYRIDHSQSILQLDWSPTCSSSLDTIRWAFRPLSAEWTILEATFSCLTLSGA